MKIVLINPNSTEAMTADMLRAAKVMAPSGMVIEAVTSTLGPPSIQGVEDGNRATAPLLDLVQAADEQGADGIIIGCFDDTALSEAKALAGCPVIGIGQAAFLACALRDWRFSVITTLSVSVPIIESNIQTYSLSSSCARVRASEIPVLELDKSPADSRLKIRAEAVSSINEDNVDCIVLGCAGMTSLTDELRNDVEIPIVDPIEESVSCIAWLAGFRTANTTPRLEISQERSV